MGWRKEEERLALGSGMQEAGGGKAVGDRVKGPIAGQGGERQDSAPLLSALGKEPQLRSSRPVLSALFHLSPQRDS